MLFDIQKLILYFCDNMKVDIAACRFFCVMFVCYLMAELCEGLGEKKLNTSETRHLNIHNVTLNMLNLPLNMNKTNMTHTSKDIRYGNGTVKNMNEGNFTVTEKLTDNVPNKPDETPLPIPVMVASPAVAVGIFIFICVAYKWHTVQLDAQAKELAVHITSGECPGPCIPCSPCNNTQILLPLSHSVNTTSQFHSDSDLCGARRKSLRTPSPILLAPPGLGNHGGSSWSALSDQEVISHSPRRHSTFLL
ncbi:uncharacterized protein LOC128557495 [Mercenaria mercenaria]|uniref:uncharacterized protein LOC128557495 n=1 Tax=Mercenaria mercenaria TaxID=6596 RepID=UPI00234E57C6|nr:uncharacterized protein LOC128557495 [Mercenaria mercenaria]